MGKNTVLVTGATGLLGRQVLQYFFIQGWESIGTSLTRPNPSAQPSVVQLDITDKVAVERLLDDIKPSVVVHCAADRFPDSCNANPENARAINSAATGNLASASYSRGIFLIYISTDYVFSGRPGEAPYKSSSTPDPTNVYGQTKLEGEREVFKVTSSSTDLQKISPVVLRVPVLYGPTIEGDKSQSVVNVMLSQVWSSQSNTAEEASAKPKLKMDHYAQRFPTNTEDVARVCFDIAKLYLSEHSKKELPSVLQFSGEEQFTKYEMCKVLADILGLPLDGMEPDKPAEDSAVQRPYDCHLDTGDLKSLNIDVSAIKFETWWRRELHAFRH